MRIAVLFCGEYRQFDIAIKSFEFLNQLDCDYYFSTWNVSSQKNPNLNINLNEKVHEDMVLKYLPNASVNIVDITKHPELNDNTKKMIFHWKNALNMVKDSGRQYDVIIVTRPDSYLRINFPIDYFNKMNLKDRIYGIDRISLVGKNMFTMDDTFISGDFEVVSSFINNLNIDTPMHYGFAQILMDMGLFVERLEMGCALIRANCRDLESPCFGTISDKRQEWFNAYHAESKMI